MREILFRGICTETGDWVNGFYVRLNGKEHRIYSGYAETDCGDYYPDWEQVAPDTVGQFTGLTDKNGKKIFEGDVVKFTDSPFGYSYIGVVCFNKGSFCIKYEYWKKEKFHRIGKTGEWQDMGASGIVTYQYEILGNIHDNPELLEKP